jgi:hypothetical protein
VRSFLRRIRHSISSNAPPPPLSKSRSPNSSEASRMPPKVSPDRLRSSKESSSRSNSSRVKSKSSSFNSSIPFSTTSKSKRREQRKRQSPKRLSSLFLTFRPADQLEALRLTEHHHLFTMTTFGSSAPGRKLASQLRQKTCESGP